MARIHFNPPVAPLAPLSLLPTALSTAPSIALAPALPVAVPVPAAAHGAGAPPTLAATAGLYDGAAMRPDQVFMARQLAWPALDGAALAAAWRGMVRSYAAQVALAQQYALGQQLPGPLLMAALHPGGPARAPAAPLWHPEAWRFVLPGAHGQQLALRVLDGIKDPPPARRKRARAALRLELTLADGQRATLQLEWSGAGAVLELTAEEAPAVLQLQQALPVFRHAIEQAGLALARSGVRQGTSPARALQHYSAEVDAALPPALFRAMAELALLLAAD
jgi:hypothetical protein